MNLKKEKSSSIQLRCVEFELAKLCDVIFFRSTAIHKAKEILVNLMKLLFNILMNTVWPFVIWKKNSPSILLHNKRMITF